MRRGDRVILKVNHPDGNPFLMMGMTGTIREKGTEYTDNLNLCILWDKESRYLTNSNQWWVAEEHVDLVIPSPKRPRMEGESLQCYKICLKIIEMDNKKKGE